MLKVIDVGAVLELATARGAELIDSPRDWEYGERQAAVTDPFGHQWILNQTLSEVAPPSSWVGRPWPPSTVGEKTAVRGVLELAGARRVRRHIRWGQVAPQICGSNLGDHDDPVTISARAELLPGE